MLPTANIRLPGVYFLPPPRAGGLGLPPLDVAGFVGFAERGPLDTPIAIDDPNHYAAVFGGDLPLAREQGGTTVYARLPDTVATFFANGGRRCHVVRVAGKNATTTRFRVPGMLALSEPNDPLRVSPRSVKISASSPGGWSERLRLATLLEATPLPVDVFSVTSGLQLSWLPGGAPQAIQKGDVLRLTFSDSRQWLFPVDEVDQTGAAPGAPVKLIARAAWRLETATGSSPPQVVQNVGRLADNDSEQLVVSGTLSTNGEGIEFEMIGADAERVSSGDVLRLLLNDGSTFLFPVTQTSVNVSGSPQMSTIKARAMQMIRFPGEPLPLLTSPTFGRVERLRFDLFLREGKLNRPTLSELSFNTGGIRFWGDITLAESNALRGQSAADPDGDRAAFNARLFRLMQGSERIDESRFGRPDAAVMGGVLAPVDEPELTYLPLDMPVILREEGFVGPLDIDVGQDDLDGAFQDDGGIVPFSALFVDAGLVPNLNVQPASGDALMNEALDRFYVRNKRLRGLHSLMFVDEVALISVPDAAHCGWTLAKESEQPPTVFSPPIMSPAPTPPDDSQFHDCDPPPAPSSKVPKAVEPTESKLPRLIATQDFDLDELLSIHHAMLNFCQARRDVLSIFSLPLHFEKRQCIEWQENLRKQLGLPTRRAVFDAGARDISDLSYAAVFHPWLLLRDVKSPDRLRRAPCDGAVCGTIAARERERQVWVAPANTPLQAVLGLTPSISTDDWADLFDLQFNLVRAEPRDFRVMSAHTLSDEAILLQLSVRRLMILLRKVAVERGMDFVFETNDGRFREGVRLMLEEILRFMFERGAFSGATPEQSYRVVTDQSVNPPESVDAGRFIALIQVAPSQPMEFITVLLTRIGDDLLQAREA